MDNTKTYQTIKFYEDNLKKYVYKHNYNNKTRKDFNK